MDPVYLMKRFSVLKRNSSIVHKHIRGAFYDYHPNITEWDKPVERVFNGQKIMGRPTRGFGDAPFKYAGKRYSPDPWETAPAILAIKIAAESLITERFLQEVNFTFCLAGHYPQGSDSIPHHSDTVPSQDSLVLSISFGAPRLFEWNQYSYYIKKKTNTSKTHILHGEKYLKTTRYILEHGDVMLFDGESQMTSTHAVPSIVGGGERINLTFREL